MADWELAIGFLVALAMVSYATSKLEEIRKELTAIKHILEGRK